MVSSICIGMANELERFNNSIEGSIGVKYGI